MELLGYEREHVEILRESLAECMVLLKSNGDFPLESAGKVALYGNGARHTLKGGTGSGEVNSRYHATVEEGLERAGFTVTTSKWLDEYDKVREEARKAFLAEIRARAKANHTLAAVEGMGAVMPEPEYELEPDGEGDVAVYVLSRISGEGKDREAVPGDIMLSATERRDILKLQEKYDKFVLILNVGGVLDLSEVAEVENILLLSQLGVETGDAVADVLLGKKNPSGKLTTTWTAWQDYCMAGDFGDWNDTRYKEGIYVGYRYFDTVGKRAMFPFGFGLSYTEFTYEVEGAVCKEGIVDVNVKVKNTGKMAGKEVLQLYLSCPSGKLKQPYQSLADFTKTKELQPGEETTCRLTCRMEDLASYDEEEACYVLEKGTYLFMVGNSSVDTVPCAVVTSEKDIKTLQVKNCCGKPDFEDWEPENPVSVDVDAIDAACPRFGLAEGDIAFGKIIYDAESETDAYVDALSDEQLAYMNVGAFSSKGGIGSIIGNASTTIAGAAGETSSVLEKDGVPTMVMADGPAGLRLAKDYFVDAKGAHAVGQTMPQSVVDLLSPLERWVVGLLNKKPKKQQEILHHYMTAIPIGTAIAQSFNLDFAEKCGDIVGDEMERAGVHLWLAPALNIHRNIRCGRNFEYFSEDPIISGKFAAAITKGVQKHPKCGVTIKHYAANNQENNRYSNNSILSERALREIYLKGFGLCVKEACPKAVMTSYNLINGVHTSESRDLIQSVLRDEFGFDGIVMTDWIVMQMFDKKSVHAAPSAGGIAAAGSDLVMPGSMADMKDILAKLKTGVLDRKQVKQNVTRVYKQLKDLSS